MLPWRTALITGASSGIGLALSERLSRAGVKVLLCARREEELRSIAARLEREGGQARPVALDVSDSDRTAETIQVLDDEEGGIDLVVANAGIGETHTPRDASGKRMVGGWSSFAPVARVNFDGAIATLSAILPRMVERRRGHLVGVSSIAALSPLPHSAIYCATKAGLSMFLEALRLDLEGTGVHVTVVQPGFIRTPLTEKNTFPMPFMLELDDAADLLFTRLQKQPAEITFPQKLATLAKLNGALPRPLRSLVARSPLGKR